MRRPAVHIQCGSQTSFKPLGKGNFFGEMALLDNQPRSADVVAVAPTTCFGLTGWSFEGILKKEPEMVFGIMKELTRRLRESDAALTE